MTLNENTETKKTRRKRAITLVDGVEGTEISLYTKSLKEPSIKIAFLHLDKKIFKDVIKIYFHEKLLTDFDVLNYCNLIYYSIILNKTQKVNEIYQAIQNIFVGKQVRNFEIRHLFRNPYFEVTIPSKQFMKYNEKVKKEFFEQPLKAKGEINIWNLKKN